MDKRGNYFVRLLAGLGASERVTAFLAFCSLVVAIGSLCASVVSCNLAADTTQIQRAVTNLSVLAGQTKRQADALGSELDEMRGEERIMANTEVTSERQLNTSSDTERRTLRAYVDFSDKDEYGRAGFPFEWTHIVEKPIAVGIFVYNTGRTPATALAFRGDVELIDKPTKADRDPSGLKERLLVDGQRLAAGKTSWINPTLHGQIDPNDVKDWFSGKNRLYFVATITYADAFGGNHKSRYCVWYTADGTSTFCHKHNTSY